MTSPVTKTVELLRPYKFGSEDITKIEMRKPTTKDLREMPVGELKFGDLLDLAYRLTILPKKFFDELDADDGMAVVEAVSGFMKGGQATGGNG